jgi:hypothetical protein
MSHRTKLILLASLLLTVATSATALAQSPPQGVVVGTYNSYSRAKDGTSTLFPNLDRVVQIVPNRLGGLRFIVSDRNGNLLGSRLLVPTCQVTYDPKLASYFQRFQTRALRPGETVEQITVVFRINDPIGDYDFYFKPPNGPLTSEVLKRRDP